MGNKTNLIIYILLVISIGLNAYLLWDTMKKKEQVLQLRIYNNILMLKNMELHRKSMLDSVPSL